LTGTTIVQNELERSLSGLTGFGDSILFASGYCANLGALSGLIKQENLIVHDKLNHASLMDGTVLSGAKMLRFKHNNLEDLENILKKNAPEYPKGGILVATDGVFSMDGDIADIPGILRITRKYGCPLLIDEAHATGVIGEKGAGTLSHFNIAPSKDIILTGCMSKALGVVGGYISAHRDITDYLRVYSRSNMFSTSLPPGNCASVLASLELMRTTDIVGRLRHNSEYLRTKLKDNGFNTLSSETAIIPVVIGDELKTSLISKDALESGVVVNPIFTPAVPANSSRLRVSVMASHTPDDMDMLVSVLINLFDKYEVPGWK
jgi:7-keto-8-aminopelargonate synthetase-like enzyme